MNRGKLSLLLLLFTASLLTAQSGILRINLLGYLPDGEKTAVLLLYSNTKVPSFTVHDALTGKAVYTGKQASAQGAYAPYAQVYRLRFSDFRQRGSYIIRAAGAESPVFRISPDVYAGTADFLLQYIRQQRCGYNPFLKDSCHTNDGFTVYQAGKDSVRINATGGWHDASDYLRYVTTAATTVTHLMLAFKKYPHVFGDRFDQDGKPAPNGVADAADEATWGMKWLARMNPAYQVMYNQIADDRDHRGFKLPNQDSISYGRGLERPVYFVTGEPQGFFKYKNQTAGVSSTAGKFAAAFAIGAKELEGFFCDFAEGLAPKAVDAYLFGQERPGKTQTAPCVSPYYYEEDNYTDDMELAAAMLFTMTGNKKYLQEAAAYGRKEPVTPWMGADTMRHYQWYPFFNLGHYIIAKYGGATLKKEFTGYMRRGISQVMQRGLPHPFRNGVPFIWCSNNLTAAMLTQIALYKELTGSTRFNEFEAALRDWLFGCNPWGSSMVIGLPAWGDSPADPHSAFSHNHGYPVHGGLVDGPVYTSIYNRLLGITLGAPDEYEAVQPADAVYHDDWGDYSTNEPTLDGTANLLFYLASLEHAGAEARLARPVQRSHGAVLRGNTAKKQLSLVFTAHEFGEGIPTILEALSAEGVHGSFFFTGDFYRNPLHHSAIARIRRSGHYLGGHSDKHLLYASWEHRDSTLLSKQEFITDLRHNYEAMALHGIEKEDAPFFLPPFEWYNDTISSWTAEAGLQLINFTPGSGSNRDYTTPDMGPDYAASDTIYQGILRFASDADNGLNGFILLTHAGTHPARTDKFYTKLRGLIRELKRRGYSFVPLQTLAGG